MVFFLVVNVLLALYCVYSAWAYATGRREPTVGNAVANEVIWAAVLVAVVVANLIG